ncbi:hypothetical protein F2Q69_00049418 [Brassica cretica]|uniref:Uncharacterized protein n=4 Tax=Brassica TaxID=3705 RepID=A0A8S9PP93_BRACR|nr:hypothetical protein F2Q69_00049418 [Brassica cretica]
MDDLEEIGDFGVFWSLLSVELHRRVRYLAMDGDLSNVILSSYFNRRYSFEFDFQCHQFEVNRHPVAEVMLVLLKSGVLLHFPKETMVTTCLSIWTLLILKHCIVDGKNILEIFLLFTQCSSSILVKCVKQSTTLMESRQLGVPAMLPLFKLHENDVIGTFDDVVASESSDLLKKTSLGINANGTKQVENSVKPPPKKT